MFIFIYYYLLLFAVPSKSRKQEFSPQINPPLSLPLKPVPVPQKPVEIKPKPLQHSSSTKNKTEMVKLHFILYDLIDWCLKPTSAIFQLYSGGKKNFCMKTSCDK